MSGLRPPTLRDQAQSTGLSSAPDAGALREALLTALPDQQPGTHRRTRNPAVEPENRQDIQLGRPRAAGKTSGIPPSRATLTR